MHIDISSFDVISFKSSQKQLKLLLPSIRLEMNGGNNTLLLMKHFYHEENEMLLKP